MRGKLSFFDRRGHETGVFAGIAATQVATGVRVISGVFKAWFLISHFGLELFGLWAVLTSWQVLANMLDFGLGASLQNEVSRQSGARERAELVQGAVLVFGAMAALVILVYLLSRHLVVPWAEGHFELSAASRQVFAQGLDTMVVLGALQLASEPLRRAVLGWRRVASFNWMRAAGDVLQLAGLLVAALLQWPFVVFLAILGFTPVFVALAAFALAVSHGLGEAWGKFSPKIRTAAALARVGLPFGATRLISLVALQLPPLLLLWLVSDAAVAAYAIPMRIAAIARQSLSSLGNVWWPRLASLSADRDGAEFRRLLSATLGLGILIAVAILVALPLAVHILGHGEIESGPMSAAGFAAWVLLSGLGWVFTVRILAQDRFLLVLPLAATHVLVQAALLYWMTPRVVPSLLIWGLAAAELVRWPLFFAIAKHIRTQTPLRELRAATLMLPEYYRRLWSRVRATGAE